MSIKKRINGFTLLEIMVAMIIFAILAAGFFNTMASSRYLVSRSKRRLIGMEIAQQAIETNRRLVNASRWYNTSDPLYPTGGWTGWAAVASNPNYYVRFKVENVTAAGWTPECRKITVQVEWNETGV
jgi:prepilin-type N-terminal cleavage/methylation domain-containing protein